MSELKIGDRIYHKSNASIIWIIETINENEVYCSTVLQDTFEQKKELFSLTSIAKYEVPKSNFVSKKRNDFW